MDYTYLNLMRGVPYENLGKSGFDPDDFNAPEMPLQPSRNAQRIAEIQQRLAEIADEKKKYDVETEMGKYKFLYEGDPSVYMQSIQNKRNAEQTEQIRKATEEATKASTTQNQWKQLLIDEEVANYDLATAKNRVNQARETGDKAAYIQAKTDESRVMAVLNRIDKDKKLYKAQFAQQLGILDDEKDTAESGLNVGYNPSADPDIKLFESSENVKAGLQDVNTDVKPKAKSVSSNEKSEKLKAANERLAQLKEQVKDANLTNKQRADLNTQIRNTEDAIAAYEKSQGVTMSKERFYSMKAPELRKYGEKIGKMEFLKLVNQGWTNGYVDVNQIADKLKE